jgi:hypothetical protein
MHFNLSVDGGQLSASCFCRFNVLYSLARTLNALRAGLDTVQKSPYGV